MSDYQVAVRWERGDQKFTDNKYTRAHRWIFDCGLEIDASSSAHIVPLPYSEVNAVDPEEAFVASLSSCHMLWFLSIAAGRGFRVDHYSDEATGILEKDSSQRLAMTRVTLRPRVVFSGDRLPADSDIREMHDEAHDRCFIANSVTTDVRCEPIFNT